MILDYLKGINPEKFLPKHGLECVTPEPALCFTDYLRLTNPDHFKFESFIRKFLPLLRGVGFDFLVTDKKINGYQKTWLISVYGENCGYLCGDETMGGMLDLTGRACQLLQVDWGLWCYLVAGVQEFDMRIKRSDIALDLKGDLWDSYGLNIVGISEMVARGEFNNSSRGGGAKASISTYGDWLAVRGLNGETYDPKNDCPDGLTINVGMKSSANQWCIYEKGKQLAGKSPDFYDGSLNGWVRLERRFASGSGRSEVKINPYALVYPDEAFLLDCSGVRSLVDGWVAFSEASGVKVDRVPELGFCFERVGLSMGVNIKKTAVHVANQCGRFFKTLEDIGVDILEFVDLVKRDEGVRGFDPAVYSHHLSCGLGRHGSVRSASSELLEFLRGKYGPRSDPSQLGLGLFAADGIV